MSSEDSRDQPLGKLPYERRPHGLPPPTFEEQHTLALDPIKWKPVSRGLALIFWGYFAVLSLLGAFVISFIGSRLLKETPADAVIETLRILLIIGVIGILLASLTAFLGQCFCLAAPWVSGARKYIIVSFLATVALTIVLGVNNFTRVFLALENPAFFRGPPPKPEEGRPEPAQPAPDAPKPDNPDPAKKKDGQGQEDSKIINLLLQATYLLSQFFFILFLRRVASFFRQPFLADSMGGYQTLLIFYVALNVFLPPIAMTACFFWVVMVAIQIVLAIWQMKLVAATRKAIG